MINYFDNIGTLNRNFRNVVIDQNEFCISINFLWNLIAIPDWDKKYLEMFGYFNVTVKTHSPANQVVNIDAMFAHKINDFRFKWEIFSRYI